MPLVNRAGGGGGTPQLCAQVDNFTVSAGVLTATLAWTAPTTDEDSSFVGTRIVRKVGSAPQSKSDGTVIYEGTALTYTDTGLTEGTTYYYRAFAYNAKNKYQTAMRVVSVTAISLEGNFADDDWDTIIEACQSGNVPSTWAVGDSKTMTINNADYEVVIIGKNHDTYTDGGIAPLTFQLLNCMNARSPWVQKWESYSYINNMPSNVQSAIKSVDKVTNGSIISVKLFGLTEHEVFGARTGAYVANEGTQYAYYSAGNSKIKKQDGEAVAWWLSSIYNSYNNSKRCVVTALGNTSMEEKTSYQGVSFGFCF